MICGSLNSTYRSCSRHEIRKESNQVATAADPEASSPPGKHGTLTLRSPSHVVMLNKWQLLLKFDFISLEIPMYFFRLVIEM